jgi:hypothetical protein
MSTSALCVVRLPVAEDAFPSLYKYAQSSHTSKVKGNSPSTLSLLPAPSHRSSFKGAYTSLEGEGTPSLSLHLPLPLCPAFPQNYPRKVNSRHGAALDTLLLLISPMK